ncbi:putative mitochondrial carrier protein PET8 [Physcomitrium patens]|uniref:Mitochondrial carrier protein n=1 Tax=Physcomitrium patens TaxID=3218 RepID=A0A2K1II11_PHYPA|nr:S-adenosylmethionine carrier 1, chloroplastic/mitochondrial-like [Physcomitrium patens]PNR28913.1 hypothetical protein PHYPA_027605 [Physcomitrium patens]|eukprot:XP_024362986.1 S-adenosylmethionine carrier 1, chloroplastic/mitochondrial-like [Physcomitrella patens]
MTPSLSGVREDVDPKSTILMQFGLYPCSYGNFVENLKQQLSDERSHGVASRFRNVQISFASMYSASGNSMEIERALSEGTVAPKVKQQSWRFRFPFIDDANPSEAETALNHVYAGAMARTLSQVGGHPVDTVKTRMQVRDPPKKLRKWRKNIASHHIGIGPVGVDNWFFKGPADLYRGVTGAILGTVPNALLYFAAYETSKQNLEKYLPPGVVHVASASIGTLASSIVRVPADTLKHRVQAYMHPNVFEAFRSVVTAEGIGGLYKGFWPTLMRDVPEIVIQFGVYEKLRTVVQKKRNVTKLTTPEHLLLGACAGAIAAACTMPLDLVKTRQQCGAQQAIPMIVAGVIREKGASGLFSGLGARTVHVSLMSALFFGFFEYCKLIIKPNRSGQDKLLLPKIWNKRRSKIWKRQFVRQ